MLGEMVFLAQVVPEGRVFAMDLQTLIGIGIQLINGIILALALGFILYNPVKEFMRNRSQGIQGKIDDADANMAKANELIIEYKEKIKNIDKERVEILENTRQKAKNESKNIIEEARREAQEIKKRSLESVSADKKRLQEETRIYIVEIASLMAQKYVSKKMDDETQDKLFEETLSKMEGAKWHN